MTTLPEIEAAVEELSPQQKQELFFFLVTRLRADATQLPTPRVINREQIDGWIADDEAGMRHFRTSE